MKKRTLLAFFALAIVPAALAGCTSFAPVYGTGAGGGMASARFNFAPPDSRIEQIIVNRLKLAFPGPALPTDPTLDIAASTGNRPSPVSDAYEVARPVNIRVSATLTVTQGDQTRFAATRFAETAYQGDKLTPVNIASREGAQQTAAESVAESLRAALLAGYRP